VWVSRRRLSRPRSFLWMVAAFEAAFGSGKNNLAAERPCLGSKCSGIVDEFARHLETVRNCVIPPFTGGQNIAFRHSCVLVNQTGAFGKGNTAMKLSPRRRCRSRLADIAFAACDRLVNLGGYRGGQSIPCRIWNSFRQNCVGPSCGIGALGPGGA